AALAAQTPPATITLDDAIRLALTQQPDVLSAQAEVRSAAGQLRSSRSDLLPSINASASSSRFQNISGFGAGTLNGASTSIGASQLVYDLGRTTNSVAAARAQ